MDEDVEVEDFVLKFAKRLDSSKMDSEEFANELEETLKEKYPELSYDRRADLIAMSLNEKNRSLKQQVTRPPEVTTGDSIQKDPRSWSYPNTGIFLYQQDNISVLKEIQPQKIDLIYADMIYENLDFSWVVWALQTLKDNGVIIVQTDYHTSAQMKLCLDRQGLTFINWAIYKQEWGGTSKRFFPRKHDDILIYGKGKDYKFYPDRIQIPKATAGTALDKKGTGMKTPCDVFDDLGNFMTTSPERVKVNGKNVSWQKPLKLMDRLLRPFTDIGDTILDPFLGTGTTALWAGQNNRNFIGIENSPEIYSLAVNRLEKFFPRLINLSAFPGSYLGYFYGASDEK